MANTLHPSAQKVQRALQARGFSFSVVELSASTRTAREAASAMGCRVAQIAKSLVFRGKRSHRPVLVIVSGANRVDEKKLRQLIGEPVGKATAEFVREQTGFAIGGVPPVGHIRPIETWIDEDLLREEKIWAAAGTPHALFPLSPADLPRMTGGRIVNVKKDNDATA